MAEVFALNKWRVFFSKTGMGKYISHLDLLRCFTRTIQRSGLPVVYSQGFNPHQKMTFSLPLPIGVTGGCETVDIQFEDGVTAAEIMDRLNANLPMDIRVQKVALPCHQAAEITAAEYQMKAMVEAGACSVKRLEAFLGEDEIIITKKTKKKGEKEINLMSYLRAAQVLAVEEKEFSLRVVLDAGGERNLKPDLLASAMADYLTELTISDWEIHRTAIFCKDEKGLQTIFA